jgi:hypothetical protein
MSKIQQRVQRVDRSTAVTGNGDVFNTKMPQKSRNDLEPDVNSIGKVNIRSPSKSRPIWANDSYTISLRELILGNMNKTTVEVQCLSSPIYAKVKLTSLEVDCKITVHVPSQDWLDYGIHSHCM